MSFSIRFHPFEIHQRHANQRCTRVEIEAESRGEMSSWLRRNVDTHINRSLPPCPTPSPSIMHQLWDGASRAIHRQPRYA